MHTVASNESSQNDIYVFLPLVLLVYLIPQLHVDAGLFRSLCFQTRQAEIITFTQGNQ